LNRSSGVDAIESLQPRAPTTYEDADMDDFTDRDEAGVRARARAAECAVPDSDRVTRVTFDAAPRFYYDDGRPPYELPPLQNHPAA
jgi:hypothetical protein